MARHRRRSRRADNIANDGHGANSSDYQTQDESDHTRYRSSKERLDQVGKKVMGQVNRAGKDIHAFLIAWSGPDGPLIALPSDVSVKKALIGLNLMDGSDLGRAIQASHRYLEAEKYARSLKPVISSLATPSVGVQPTPVLSHREDNGRDIRPSPSNDEGNQTDNSTPGFVTHVPEGSEDSASTYSTEAENREAHSPHSSRPHVNREILTRSQARKRLKRLRGREVSAGSSSPTKRTTRYKREVTPQMSTTDGSEHESDVGSEADEPDELDEVPIHCKNPPTVLLNLNKIEAVLSHPPNESNTRRPELDIEKKVDELVQEHFYKSFRDPYSQSEGSRGDRVYLKVLMFEFFNRARGIDPPPELMKADFYANSVEFRRFNYVSLRNDFEFLRHVGAHSYRVINVSSVFQFQEVLKTYKPDWTRLMEHDRRQLFASLALPPKDRMKLICKRPEDADKNPPFLTRHPDYAINGEPITLHVPAFEGVFCDVDVANCGCDRHRSEEDSNWVLNRYSVQVICDLPRFDIPSREARRNELLGNKPSFRHPLPVPQTISSSSSDGRLKRALSPDESAENDTPLKKTPRTDAITRPTAGRQEEFQTLTTDAGKPTTPTANAAPIDAQPARISPPPTVPTPTSTTDAGKPTSTKANAAPIEAQLTPIPPLATVPTSTPAISVVPSLTWVNLGANILLDMVNPNSKPDYVLSYGSRLCPELATVNELLNHLASIEEFASDLKYLTVGNPDWVGTYLGHLYAIANHRGLSGLSGFDILAKSGVLRNIEQIRMYRGEECQRVLQKLWELFRFFSDSR